MKILIVDNGSTYLPDIESELGTCTSKSVRYDELDVIKDTEFDGIILSGGHDFPVVGNENRLANEIQLIRATNTPLLGICFGFELIAAAFGARLEHLPTREKGVIDVVVTHQDGIFKGISHFQAYESHRWVVKDLGEQLEELARSKDGVEAFKHRFRKIYATQFHPELHLERVEGQ